MILPRAEYIASLPRALASAATLLRNEAGLVLLVHPTYRQDGRWLWPGGHAEDDEPPRVTARREVAEEIGLDIQLGRLLTVNWNHATDRPPLINYLYDGGMLSESQIAAITHDREIDRFAFFTVEQALPLIPSAAQGELTVAMAAIEHGWGGVELVDGQPVSGDLIGAVGEPRGNQYASIGS